MEQIQSVLRNAVQSGKLVYIHCWGGHGRTGTVAGCWLVSQGMTPEEALATMKSRREHDPRCAAECAPQEESQREFIFQWARTHHA
jgi:protein-tyrosine phosphatase